MAKKDYTVGLNVQGVGIDDPDVVFYETFHCGSQRNYTNYCNPETEKLFDQQSRMIPAPLSLLRLGVPLISQLPLIRKRESERNCRFCLRKWYSGRQIMNGGATIVLPNAILRCRL